MRLMSTGGAEGLLIVFCPREIPSFIWRASCPCLPAAGLPALFLAQLVPPFPTVDLPYWLCYCQYPIRVFGAVNNRKANSDWLKKFFNRFVFKKHSFLAHKGEVQVLGGLQFCLTSGLMIFSRTHVLLHFCVSALPAIVWASSYDWLPLWL